MGNYYRQPWTPPAKEPEREKPTKEEDRLWGRLRPHRNRNNMRVSRPTVRRLLQLGAITDLCRRAAFQLLDAVVMP